MINDSIHAAIQWFLCIECMHHIFWMV